MKEVLDPRLDQAVAWHTRLHAPDADEGVFEQFAIWLENDPSNRAAYERVEDFDVALGNAIAGEQQEWGSRSPLTRVAARKYSDRLFKAAWIAGAVAVAAGFLIFFATPANPPTPEQYATAVGQTRTIRLADGSKIDMNTATNISVQLSVGERRVTLERGEVAFRVHPNQRKPFVVRAGDRNVRDIGTVFDILRDHGSIVVAVAEGEAAVTPAGGGEQIVLRAGDRLTHREGTNLSAVDKIDPSWVTAWQRGYLVYRNAPLQQVVADLNRYYRTPIKAEESAATSQRFSGVLRLRDEDTAIAQLTAFLPIVALHENGKRILLRAAEAKP